VSAVVDLAALLRTQADALEALVRTLRAQSSALDAAQASTLPPPSEAKPLLLNKKQIARALRVSASSIDRLDRDGQPHVRVGTAKRYDLAAVLAWHAERSARIGSTRRSAHSPASEPSGVRLLSRRRRGRP
jgi:hypothetical protein